MRTYILQRIARTILTFILFEILLFVLIKAVPGEDVKFRPPQPPPPKPVATQAPQAGAVTEEPKQTTCKVDIEIPKWLPEEDKEKYLEDVNREILLQGCPTEEAVPQAVAPVVTETPGAPTGGEAYVPSEPTALQQFGYWVQGLLQGDLGMSSTRRQPVLGVLVELAPRTLILIIPGAVIGFFLGLRLGVNIAWKRGGMSEFASTAVGVTMFTAFPPFLSFLLATLFAVNLNWLPRENIIIPDLWFGASITPNQVIGWMLVTILIDAVLIYAVWRLTRWVMKRRALIRGSALALILILSLAWWIGNGYSPYALDILRHLILPLATLILLTFGTTMLLMRASMTEVIKDAHITTAKAKGLPDEQVRTRHAARLAMIPVVSRFILELPLVIISCFAIERVFYWNGLGQYLFQAANEDDYMLVLGILTVVGIVILGAHFFVDMMNLVMDPRLRKVVKSTKGE